ncbi:MAG: translocation/assembly module TamB domain-containing protein [Terrimicrobiaceae bacterium]|nr:translocation/assembly module TamB domain-containing protein [Terrimicrobiaceae bacterium]
MSERQPKRWFWIAALLLGVATAAFWVGHGPLLSRVVQDGVPGVLARHGVDFSVHRVDIRLGRPIRLEGIRISRGDSTDLEIGLLEVSLGRPAAFFEPTGRWLHRIRLANVTGFLNFADVPIAPPELRFLPETIEWRQVSAEFNAGDNALSVRGFEGRFAEGSAGHAGLQEANLAAPGWNKNVGPLKAATAWRHGVLWIGELRLEPGVTLDHLEADLLRPEGAGIAFRLDLFGGSARGDLTISAVPEAALWVSNIPLEPLPGLLEWQDRVNGRIVEARFNFRGKPEELSDAEASLRLVAEGVRWNRRGWESLEIGASLINRRLVVTDFELRQRENQLHFNGELSLDGGWEKMANAPFLLNVRAEIRELGALGDLAGRSFGSLGGRMSATGSVSGRDGKLDGFLSVEGSEITYGALPETNARVEALFRGTEMEIARFALSSGNDTVEAKGTVGLASPHLYAGEVRAKIADVTPYLQAVPQTELISAGALDVRWQGDGTRSAHSGAFEIAVRDLVAGGTPSGISGDFTGTYSPQNLYFSRFQIRDGRLELETRATFATTGVNFDGLEIRSGAAKLLEGEVAFPINIFAMLGGTDWRAAIHADQDAYLRLASPRDLPLADLGRLFGQESPVSGTLRMDLEAKGPPARLAGTGTLRGRDLRVRAEPSLPESTLDLRISAEEGSAQVDGSLATRGFSPLTVTGRMPFGLIETVSGEWRWQNPEGAFDLKAEFPRTDVAVLRPFFPGTRRMAGEISGRIDAGGTLSHPVASGRLDLRGGQLEISTRTPPLANVQGAIHFDGSAATVESFSGELGAGPFSLSGRLLFAGPELDLRLTGRKVLLARDAGMRIRANVDLTARGGPNGGTISGDVRLVDGRIYRRLEITPLLVPTPNAPALVAGSPVPSGLIPRPWDRWALDVRLSNETPFLLKGNLADGEIVPNMTFTGTLGAPIPIGRIQLNGVRAFLPFTTMTIPDGHIDFLPDTPWIPMLDIRGVARIPDYDVQAYVFGPLNENKLILRSEPPLPQESLVLLLTTGIAPGVTSGEGFGSAAVGQGGLFLLRTFARELNVPGFDLENLVNRLSLSATPARFSGESTTLRGTLQLWGDLDLMTGRDSFGFYQGGITYTWRFR